MLGFFHISHLNIKSMNLGVIIGGLIFGVAFAAFTLSMTYGFFKGIRLFEALDRGKFTLFNISDKFPSVFNSGYVGLLFIGIIFIVGSYYIPKEIIKKLK